MNSKAARAHRLCQSLHNNTDFTSDEIYYLLSHLDCFKSPGCDGSSGHILKNCASSLYSVVANILLITLASIPYQRHIFIGEAERFRDNCN